MFKEGCDQGMAGSCLLMFPYDWENHSFMSCPQVPRLVKVVLESSPYFKLISHNGVCRKVAPGMSSTFRIRFTPEENKVRPEVPRGWCLQGRLNLQGWIQNKAAGVGCAQQSWFQ